MKRSRNRFVIILILYLLFSFLCILIPCEPNYEEIAFGDDYSNEFVLKSGNSIRQVFMGPPAGCTGIVIPISDHKLMNSGIVNMTLNAIREDGSVIEELATQDFVESDIKDESIFVLEAKNTFLNSYGFYSVDISFNGNANDTIALEVQSNQMGEYANRWDTTGHGEMLSARFLIKKASTIVSIWIFVSSIFIGLLCVLYIRNGNSEEKGQINLGSKLYMKWAVVFTAVILIMILGKGITKASFQGDYQYYTEDEFAEETHELKGGKIIQHFFPHTKNLIRIFIPKECFDNADDACLSIQDIYGKTLTKVDTALKETDFLVFEIYQNEYAVDEEYILEIDGVDESKVGSFEEGALFQYRPIVEPWRVILFVAGLIATLFVIYVPFTCEKWMIRRKWLQHVILAIPLLLYAGIYLCTWKKYVQGEITTYFFSYRYVSVVLVSAITTSVLTRFINVSGDD